VIERIENILQLCHTEQRAMPPTKLYCEDWLLRVTLDWFADHPDVHHELRIPNGIRWYSEALLASQFLQNPPAQNGVRLKENYTHADGAIGNFDIGHLGEGDLSLDNAATHFVVLEAKVNSKLSKRITNDPNYDQAARTVACMGHIISVAQRQSADINTLGFFVVAPASRIDKGIFADELAIDSIINKVSTRVENYNTPAKQVWFNEWFLPMLEFIDIAPVSWENIRDTISNVNANDGESFSQFYQRCLHYNGVI
jgi:hypothetical protein